jgi:hypothetical protein
MRRPVRAAYNRKVGLGASTIIAAIVTQHHFPTVPRTRQGVLERSDAGRPLVASGK